MNWKNKIWKFATVLVVVVILFNPEMANLALFVDAVGLEMFLLLLQIQALVMLGLFLNTKIRPVFIYIKNEPGRLMLLVPSQATLMHSLVFSAAIGFALSA